MEINVTQQPDGNTIALTGRFDFQSHQVFRQTIDELLQSGNVKLTVDLSAVNFIDSSALGMLLLARESCEKVGGNVILDRPRDYVDKVLKLCHFDQLFTVQR